jgi:hypothetical protein
MSLIDSTYFANDIYLASNEYDTLDSSITRYEKELIIRTFGYDLGTIVLAYNSETSTQAIKNIVTGAIYTKNGFTIKWNGLVNSDKVSAISYYIYCKRISDKNKINTPIGSIETEHENAIKADESFRYVEAWNNAVELIGYDGQDWSISSLYNYIIEHKEDYPTCLFSPLRFKNTLGI